MTRKHFIAIARTLAETKPLKTQVGLSDYRGRLAQWEHDVNSMSLTLGCFNSNFDRQRFLTACGYNPVK